MAALGNQERMPDWLAAQVIANLCCEYGEEKVAELKQADEAKDVERRVKKIQEQLFTSAQRKAVKNDDMFSDELNNAPIKTANGGIIPHKYGTWEDNEPHYVKVKDQHKALSRLYIYLDDKREVHKPYQENNPAVTNEQVQWKVENGKGPDED
jgi:hypothetical protein